MASSDSAWRLGGGEPSVTVVERRGIEHVPQSERWGKPSGLFWMWAGAVWNVEFVYYGAIAVVFLGLSFAQAVLIILLGNLSYVLTGLASLQGPQAGTTTFAISRAPFGPRGNKLPSFFNWVTQVGFEIEGIAFIVFAAIVLTNKAGFTAGTAAKVIFIILAVAIQAVLPTLGHAAVLKALRWLAIPFVVLFVVLAILTAGKANLHSVAHGAGWGELFVFLALVIAAGGLGWTENGNDYSRYLPATHGQEADRGRRRTGRGHTFGTARDPRCRCRHRGPGRGRLADRAGGWLLDRIRGAVPDPRDHPAVRDQHAGPVFIRGYAAEPDSPAAPAALRRH